MALTSLFPRDRDKFQLLAKEEAFVFFPKHFSRLASSYFVWGFVPGLNCRVFYTKLAIIEVNAREEKTFVCL